MGMQPIWGTKQKKFSLLGLRSILMWKNLILFPSSAFPWTCKGSISKSGHLLPTPPVMNRDLLCTPRNLAWLPLMLSGEAFDCLCCNGKAFNHPKCIKTQISKELGLDDHCLNWHLHNSDMQKYLHFCLKARFVIISKASQAEISRVNPVTSSLVLSLKCKL